MRPWGGRKASLAAAGGDAGRTETGPSLDGEQQSCDGVTCFLHDRSLTGIHSETAGQRNAHGNSADLSGCGLAPPRVTLDHRVLIWMSPRLTGQVSCLKRLIYGHLYSASFLPLEPEPVHSSAEPTGGGGRGRYGACHWQGRCGTHAVIDDRQAHRAGAEPAIEPGGWTAAPTGARVHRELRGHGPAPSSQWERGRTLRPAAPAAGMDGGSTCDTITHSEPLESQLPPEHQG